MIFFSFVSLFSIVSICTANDKEKQINSHRHLICVCILNSKAIYIWSVGRTDAHCTQQEQALCKNQNHISNRRVRATRIAAIPSAAAAETRIIFFFKFWSIVSNFFFILNHLKWLSFIPMQFFNFFFWTHFL